MVDLRYDGGAHPRRFRDCLRGSRRGEDTRIQFKRLPPVIAKVPRTINRDFRYARDWE